MDWIAKSKSLLNIITENFWWVEGSIFIDDIDLEGLGLSTDIPKLKMGSLLLSPQFLTVELSKVFRPNNFDIIIWPGNGAKIVKKFLEVKGGVEVSAKRVGYGDNVSAQVSDFIVPTSKSVMVVDDVISSGVTALEVFKKGKLQLASLGAWLMQAPKNSSLKCYSNIFTGVVIRGPNGRVPANSLSTFIEKTDVLSSYAYRYAEKPEDFIEFFIWLREEGVNCVE